jgi:hypothetical protein
LFVDGKLNNTVAHFSGDYRISLWDTIIGAAPRRPGDRFVNYFNGVIEQLRISKGARYFDDYVPPAVLDADKDTLLLYRFDEGQGETIHDASGRGNDARLESAAWVKRSP